MYKQKKKYVSPETLVHLFTAHTVQRPSEVCVCVCVFLQQTVCDSTLPFNMCDFGLGKFHVCVCACACVRVCNNSHLAVL